MHYFPTFTFTPLPPSTHQACPATIPCHYLPTTENASRTEGYLKLLNFKVEIVDPDEQSAEEQDQTTY